MRDATGITVNRAIVHIVDHRKGSKPVLSEVELPLDAHQKLQEYFRDQITQYFGHFLSERGEYTRP